MEGGEHRRQNRKGSDLAEILEQLQQTAQGRREITTGFFQRKLTTRLRQKIEGVGETSSLADALACHPEPGRRGNNRNAQITP
jgi:hypothetical protein